MWGFVTDRSSGAAIVQASVSVDGTCDEGWEQTAWTRVDGYYELPITRPGEMILQFIHEATRIVVARRPVGLTAGDRVRLDVQLDAASAADVPYDVLRGEFKGRLRFAFESQSFVLAGGVSEWL